MSRSKRNIAYIKPEDPKFLRLLKAEAGYDDSNPKFETRREEPVEFASDDESEKPQVVVLRAGDLTAAQAQAEEERIQKDAAEAKADLTQKIVFSSTKTKAKNEEGDRKRPADGDDKVLKKSKQKSKPVLSFDVEEDD